MEPKFPQINVQMVGQDGNAFAILGRVQSAMRKAGIDQAERDAFREEATAGDYDHLLATVMAWVNVDGEEDQDGWEDELYGDDDE